MTTDGFGDDQLEKSEQLDSDEIRNDDGDEVVDPPQAWIEPRVDETLDERLADEIPDITPDDDEPSDDVEDSSDGGGPDVVSDVDIDHLDTERHGLEHGQVDGTPEDGGSFFDVVK